MFKVTLIAIWLATAAAWVFAQERDIPWYNMEVAIRGDYFRAATIAYEDFSKRLAERGGYLATINNYNIQVGVGPESYVVWISPRSSQEVPGLFGGGAFYTIDARTFTVREKEYSK
jgi:hypothetical protein